MQNGGANGFMSALFNLINIPFSYVIRFFYSISGNYMIALLGFAVVVKLVLFPLGIKQQKNMVKQAKLRPKEMAIRARYAGRTDQVTQQKMQQEVMALYQEENYNPASGCLPMIIQLIVIWAIYQIVYGPLTYLCSMSADALTALKTVVPQMIAGLPDAAAKFTEMKILSVDAEGVASFRGNEIQLIQMIKALAPGELLTALQNAGSYTAEVLAEIEKVLGDLPNMRGIWHDLSETPSIAFNSLLLIPVINLVTTFLTTKLTRKLSYQAPSAEDQQNNISMKIMEYGMPFMIFYMAFRLPAALGLYWIFQNVLGVGQSFILYKLYPYPTFTEEEMKEAAKAVNSRRDEKSEKSGRSSSSDSGKSVRSLHHIDDDEEYTPREKKPSLEVPDAPADPNAEVLPEEKENAPEENAGIKKAKLKGDNPHKK